MLFQAFQILLIFQVYIPDQTTDCLAGDPTSAVDGKKQKKISKTADYYRMLHQIPMDVPCRFDVVAETPEEIRVYANAFYYQGSGW